MVDDDETGARFLHEQAEILDLAFAEERGGARRGHRYDPRVRDLQVDRFGKSRRLREAVVRGMGSDRSAAAVANAVVAPLFLQHGHDDDGASRRDPHEIMPWRFAPGFVENVVFCRFIDGVPAARPRVKRTLQPSSPLSPSMRFTGAPGMMVEIACL
jgi:hypothetical protein